MKESILTKKKDICYICGRPATEIHHIYFGTALRKISDKNGFIVPLCRDCHTGGKHAVHRDRRTDLMLKAECQTLYESFYGHAAFMKLIGRNYL